MCKTGLFEKLVQSVDGKAGHKLAFRPKSVQLVKITLLSSSKFLHSLTVSLPPTHREEYKGLPSE